MQLSTWFGLGGLVTCASRLRVSSEHLQQPPKKPAWHPDETEAAAELGLSRSRAVVGSGSWRRSAFVFGIKRKSSSFSSRVFGALARHLPAQWCHTMSRADLTAAPEVDLDVGGWQRTGGRWCRCVGVCCGGHTLDGACACSCSSSCVLNIYALQRVSCTKSWSCAMAREAGVCRCGGGGGGVRKTSWNVNVADSFKVLLAV